MQPTISVRVPVSKVYFTFYSAFWHRLGCQVETAEQSSFCKITFPPGTTRERRLRTHEPRFLLRFPNQTTIEEVQGNNCSYLYAHLEVQQVS